MNISLFNNKNINAIISKDKLKDENKRKEKATQKEEKHNIRKEGVYYTLNNELIPTYNIEDYVFYAYMHKYINSR